MGGRTGMYLPLTILVTREVRWFFDGALPSAIFDWFAESGNLVLTERRIDNYDLSVARLGSGRKKRAGGPPLDSKIRLSSQPGVWIGEGMAGHIEDWAKLSNHLPCGHVRLDGEVIVTKEIFTRCFDMEGTADSAFGPSGCEAELASVRAGTVEAWTLCFETYGDPEMRHQAFRNGINTFLDETPLPEGLQLSPADSSGYPNWLASQVMGNEALA